MFVRLIVSSAVACGLLAISSAALADTAAARMFRGKTAQSYPIKVLAKKRKLKLVHFAADLRCGDGSILTLAEDGFLWTPTGKTGSFRDSQFGDGDSVYFRGQMSGKRIRGRVRLINKERGEPRCSSRWISFNATPH
ncbi:MAG: hypothetical protein ACRDLL_05115 [Solirubrobacterales bacterium]